MRGGGGGGGRKEGEMNEGKRGENIEGCERKTGLAT